MRVRLAAAGIGLLALTACATTTATPLSLTAMMHLQLRERAGTYPPDSRVDGATHEAQYVTLAAWAERKGIVVTTASLSRRHQRGSVQPGYGGGLIILLEARLSPNEKLYTLLHELGHVYGPKAPTEEERETLAELIAAMVCQRLGLDVWPQTATYLAFRVPDLDVQAHAVQTRGEQIDRVVNAFVRVITG